MTADYRDKVDNLRFSCGVDEDHRLFVLNTDVYLYFNRIFGNTKVVLVGFVT